MIKSPGRGDLGGSEGAFEGESAPHKLAEMRAAGPRTDPQNAAPMNLEQAGADLRRLAVAARGEPPAGSCETAPQSGANAAEKELAGAEKHESGAHRTGVSVMARLKRFPGQLLGVNPFSGDIEVERLPTMRFGASTIANLHNPLKILDRAFACGSDFSYLDVPGFSPIMFLSDPEMAREILVQTAHKGDFERDSLTTQGIKRVTGAESLLTVNDDAWRAQKAALAPVFGGRAVHTPEVYAELDEIISSQLIDNLARYIPARGDATLELESKIKVAALEILQTNLFGGTISREELKEKFLPSIERGINYIFLDTFMNPLGISLLRMPTLSNWHAQLKRDYHVCEELVDNTLEAMKSGRGFWDHLTVKQLADLDTFKSLEPAIRANIKTILAGALEGTASYMGFVIKALGDNPRVQAKLFREIRANPDIKPEDRAMLPYLENFLLEVGRLYSPLYIIPRISKKDVSVTTSKGTLNIPAHTHIIIAAYHMNRSERHWGVEATGYPADQLVPERWDDDSMRRHNRSKNDNLTFTWGHGPRACSGKTYGQVELRIGTRRAVENYYFTAADKNVPITAGIATRTADRFKTTVRFRAGKGARREE